MEAAAVIYVVYVRAMAPILLDDPPADISWTPVDLAAAIEKQTRRNRVRRGRRADGLLVAIGDADPEVAYRCPVCGGSLTQKESSREKPFFCHIGGDGTCADDLVRHAAAVLFLGDLVDHALAGRLVLRFAGRCSAGRHATDLQVELRAGDVMQRDDHGVAVMRDGTITCILVVHRAHGDRDESAGGTARFEVGVDDILGWDADEALEACQSGGQASLTLSVRVGSDQAPCPRCATEQATEQVKTTKAAALAAQKRTERIGTFAQEIKHGRRRFETGFCDRHPDVRTVIDIRDNWFDDLMVDYQTEDGERWDIALGRDGELVLGILLVGPDSMRNESALDHRCRNPGRSYFLAVPMDALIDPRSGAWPTNAWHLKSAGRCPRCTDLPDVVADIHKEEAAYAARFEVGRPEILASDIRSEFIDLLDEQLPGYPRVIEAEVEAATEDAIRRLIAAATQVWPPSMAEARRAQETRDTMAQVDRIATAYARKHLVAGKPPKTAADIHRAMHWLIDRAEELAGSAQPATEQHIAAVIAQLVNRALRLWPGHEGRAAIRRQGRRMAEEFGLRRRWGNRRDR